VPRLSDSAVASFQESMPERYRAHFDGEAIHEHAAIVARLAGFLVHVEIWQRSPDGGAVLCVVADDRPGLLSLISASLVVHDIDIVAVKAYTRTDPETGRAEAVDFVSVHRDATPPLRFVQADVTRISGVLTAFISGEATVQSVLRKDRLPPRVLPGTPTRVIFEGTADEGPDILTVETVDRPGLLLTITQALYRAGVQIVASDAMTRDGRVADRFTIVEGDGTRIGRPRRGAVQKEVLTAIESLAGAASKRRTTKPPKPERSPK
jgi:[protein-PII] uridylyltransferase